MNAKDTREATIEGRALQIDNAIKQAAEKGYYFAFLPWNSIIDDEKSSLISDGFSVKETNGRVYIDWKEKEPMINLKYLRDPVGDGPKGAFGPIPEVQAEDPVGDCANRVEAEMAKEAQKE